MHLPTKSLPLCCISHNTYIPYGETFLHFLMTSILLMLTEVWIINQ